MSASGMVATIRRITTSVAVRRPASVTKRSTGVPDRMNSTCRTNRKMLTFTSVASNLTVRRGIPPAHPTAMPTASRQASTDRLSVRNAATHTQNANAILTSGFNRCTIVVPGA